MQQKVKIICDSWRKKDKDGQVCREDEVDPSVILTNFLFFARIILYLHNPQRIIFVLFLESKIFILSWNYFKIKMCSPFPAFRKGFIPSAADVWHFISLKMHQKELDWRKCHQNNEIEQNYNQNHCQVFKLEENQCVRESQIYNLLRLRILNPVQHIIITV